ncbi:MAG: alpha/beta fold hydrolase [Acidobacteriia bacterium]|nr:alpha/beta fold hydrolase [Terriglobia bacterium]
MTGAQAVAQTGDWIATLAFGSAKLRLALHLAARPGGQVAATADSIDQNAFGLKVARVESRGSGLRFTVPRLVGRFSGSFSEDGAALAGTWTERQGSLPMRFARGNIRPQEPAPPYPYDSGDVVFHNGAVRLAGILTLPRTPGPHRAVILLSGSGPQDRNETSAGHRPFLVWSDYLTRRGFAVLRMDDRGVGRSTGRLLDSTDEDFAADALAAVEFLKGRKEIDPRRIGLLGYSEGGGVAALAAQHSAGVAFVALLAGPAVRGEQILFAQSERIARAMGVPEEVAAKSRDVQRKLFEIARQGGPGERQRMEAVLARETDWLTPEAAAAILGQVGGQIPLASSRWFRFVLDFDPGPALARIQCPVLALYGGLDLQVPADLDAPAMEKALAANPNHKVLTLSRLNHMFQTAATGSPLEYSQIEETVAPLALKAVGDWMASTAGGRFAPPVAWGPQENR